ncbi:MAG: DUF4238 domain-containing protein [Leptolyngbya sp. SIO1D8]|nr:DUF4238 domain-containing protein [Leptolyngbya sp. SIO1D8]
MTQNQHHIQQSWLKQFASKDGLVEICETATGRLSWEQPGNIAYEADFQSEANESEDGRVESRGIQTLHQLEKRPEPVPVREHGWIIEWVALHLSRSPRSRSDLDGLTVSYDQARSSFLADDLKRVRRFSQLWISRVEPSDEPLIVSDHPILDMGSYIIVPYTPSFMLFFADQGPNELSIEGGRTIAQVSNELSYKAAQSCAFSNPELKVPWKEIAIRSNTVGTSVQERQVPVKRKP